MKKLYFIKRMLLVFTCIGIVSGVQINGLWFKKDANLSDPKVAKLNAKAPNFKGLDSNLVEHNLKDFKGKIVVLEWKNIACPFVKKHYKSGNMQALQKKATQNDIVWLSIVSSAKGKQGHQNPETTRSQVVKEGSHATAVILDQSGDIGRLYGAKTTPHMFVIDKKGVLVYEGAIDSIRSANQKDIPKAINYVAQAIDSLQQNKPILVQQSKAYGCSIKY